MAIRILRKSDMQELITMKEVIEADRLALKLYSAREVDIPLRSVLTVKKHKGKSLYMPGYAEEANALGVKIVSVYPGNIDKGAPTVPATMILLDPETGVVNCLMDGPFLTQLRTGAVSGLATDYLARKDASVMLLIGTGEQAATQLEAVLNVRNIKQVYVSSRNQEHVKTFVQAMTERFGETFGVTITPAENVEEAAALADVITTVTTAREPVIHCTHLKPGVHINAVGSFLPSMIEVDPQIFGCASLVYVDTADAVSEAGEFQMPMERGLIAHDVITGELGQLVLGETKGRENDDQITFFKTTGNAVMDIVAARQIYERAIEKNIGQIIEF